MILSAGFLSHFFPLMSSCFLQATVEKNSLTNVLRQHFKEISGKICIGYFFSILASSPLSTHHLSVSTTHTNNTHSLPKTSHTHTIHTCAHSSQTLATGFKWKKENISSCKSELWFKWLSYHHPIHSFVLLKSMTCFKSLLGWTRVSDSSILII